jgi:hypothetical protein
MEVINGCFSLRVDESVAFATEEPTYGRYLAVQLRSVEMPTKERRKSRNDGKPPMQCVLVACERNDYLWQWVHMDAPTSAAIAVFMTDRCFCQLDKWYYITFVNLCRTSPPTVGAGCGDDD